MSWLTKTTRLAALAVLAFSIPYLTGCAAVALTAGSLAAGTGISHTLSGVVSKTFTAPMETVEYANTRALKDMGINIVGRETNEDGERVVTAEANDRKIEILPRLRLSPGGYVDCRRAAALTDLDWLPAV